MPCPWSVLYKKCVSVHLTRMRVYLSSSIGRKKTLQHTPGVSTLLFLKKVLNILVEKMRRSVDVTHSMVDV